MNILLVYPSHLDENGLPVKYKKALFIPPLSLAILDGLTPSRHSVTIINDIAEYIDFSVRYDLVGISATTPQSERSYQIAEAFRSRGVKVVLGGMHPSVLPREAKDHADAVVIGEAEPLWQEILDDFEQDTFKDYYQTTTFPESLNPVVPRWDHMNMGIYPKPPGWSFPLLPLYTTRGCPMGCSYCTVSRFFGKHYRMKPISHVMDEIDAMGARYRFFVDDNITLNSDYAGELFAALSKKPIYWGSQISPTVLKNPELIDLAAGSGCKYLLMGMESMDQESLKGVQKGFNNVDQYEELIERMCRARITPVPMFMFGFDEGSPDQFRLTLEFLMKNRLRVAIFWILTPYPGTDIFEKMVKEGRIEHRKWSLYDASHVVFTPKNLSKGRLLDSFWKTYREFYSLGRLYDLAVTSRLRSLLPNLGAVWIMRRKVYAYEHPFLFGFGRLRHGE